MNSGMGAALMLGLALALPGCFGQADRRSSPQTNSGAGGSGNRTDTTGDSTAITTMDDATGVTTVGENAGGMGNAPATATSTGTATVDPLDGGAAGQAGAPSVTRSGLPVCGELDPDRADDCENLELIYPRSPGVSSLTSGAIQVTEFGPVDVWIHNDDDVYHDDVCVGVTVDTSAVVILDHDDSSVPYQPLQVAGLTPGIIATITPADAYVVGPAGGTATFTFWTTYVGTRCEGPSVSITAPIIPYP